MEDVGAHPFAGYNLDKGGKAGALVGNWVEERALQDETGCFRYKGWAEGGANGAEESVYPTRVRKADTSIETGPRVMGAPLAQEVGGRHFQTVKQQIVADPQSHVSDPVAAHYVDTSKPGKRGAKRDKELWDIASALPEPVAPPPCFGTTHRETFTGLPVPPPETLGRRVMKTQDHKVVPMDRRDGTFQSELGLLPQSSLNRSVQPRDPLLTDVRLDEPITIYSTAQPGAFQETFNKGTRRFNKACDFSKPMDDPTKVVEGN